MRIATQYGNQQPPGVPSRGWAAWAEDAMSLAASPERKCPIIALASTKGGVGKTTLAYVLATEMTRRLSSKTDAGRVTCIDADPNRTLAQVLHLTDDKLIVCVESDSDRLLTDLREAQSQSDLVIIDLEGTANQAMLYAAGQSDRCGGGGEDDRGCAKGGRSGGPRDRPSRGAVTHARAAPAGSRPFTHSIRSRRSAAVAG